MTLCALCVSVVACSLLAASPAVIRARVVPEHTIQVTNAPPFYAPATVTVRAGETVHWRSNGHSDTHSVREALHGTFALEIPPGGEVSHQFKRAGEYPYRCRYHPWMMGRIVVRPKRLAVQWQPASENPHRVRFEPARMHVGPDGMTWSLDPQRGKIVRRGSNGDVVEFTIPPALGAPGLIAPDGHGVWIATMDGRIAQLVNGEIEEYEISPPVRGFAGIVARGGELLLLDLEERRIGHVVLEERTVARLQ